MSGFLRMLLGLVLLPACWGFARAFVEVLVRAAGAEGYFSAATLSVLFGVAAFSLVWMALPRPIRTYVFGHEFTHALWGLMFGAVPSELKVGAAGGSVRLSKSNLLITLAPYFFPFYTFVVLVAALITSAFMRPLPCLPLWLFAIGFTWAFHVLFTLETLTCRQPDVKVYGRIFSWTFILLMNVLLVVTVLSAATSLSFGEAYGALYERTFSAYMSTGHGLMWLYKTCCGR